MSSPRARLGQFAGRFIPGLDDRVFNRDRDRSVPRSQAPKGGYARTAFRERPIHILVAPAEGPGFPDWCAGTRNFYYEVWQSAREIFGDSAVSVLDIEPHSAADTWQKILVDQVRDSGATHVITHIEHDPGAANRWTWDEAWNTLAPHWDGVLLGVMFDSAYDLVTSKSRRLARMSPQFLAVDICTPMNDVLIRGRSEVGPVTMPVSRQSLALVHERIDGITATHDVSFIGALYPYRVQLIEELRAFGIDVAVNPHRDDATHDFVSSRTNQPSWLDYMVGLAESRMTINFSRSSAGNFEQLKTRVIEATLAGTLLLTDDKNSTRLFFEPERDFGYFTGVSDLPTVVQRWLGEPERLDTARLAAQERAQEIALFDFWKGISAGLIARDLPRLPDALR